MTDEKGTAEERKRFARVSNSEFGMESRIQS